MDHFVRMEQLGKYGEVRFWTVFEGSFVVHYPGRQVVTRMIHSAGSPLPFGTVGSMFECMPILCLRICLVTKLSSISLVIRRLVRIGPGVGNYRIL